MKKIDVCRKVTEFGKAGQRTLIYFITSEHCDIGNEGRYEKNFGVGISVGETGEEISIRNITAIKEKAEKLCDILASNYVTPIALSDVVEDWLCDI